MDTNEYKEKSETDWTSRRKGCGGQHNIRNSISKKRKKHIPETSSIQQFSAYIRMSPKKMVKSCVQDLARISPAGLTKITINRDSLCQ
jgi:hypothetical protein